LGDLAAKARGLVAERKHLGVLQPSKELRCAIKLLGLMPSAHNLENRHCR
jgi:hypothetical protein